MAKPTNQPPAAIERERQTKLAQAAIEQAVLSSRPIMETLGVNEAAFRQTALNALILNPAIVACSPQSIEREVIKAVRSGVEIDGVESALVPFRGQAVLIKMITGKIKLLRQSYGNVRLRTRCVFDGDRFEHREGFAPDIVHVPNPESNRVLDEMAACYAIAEFPDGTREFEVHYHQDTLRYRARSPSYNADGPSPWKSDPLEMAKKSVLGQLIKRLPVLDKHRMIHSIPDADDLQGLAGQDLPLSSFFEDLPSGELSTAPAPSTAPTPPPSPSPTAAAVPADPEPAPPKRGRGRPSKKQEPQQQQPVESEAPPSPSPQPAPPTPNTPALSAEPQPVADADMPFGD